MLFVLVCFVLFCLCAYLKLNCCVFHFSSDSKSLHTYTRTWVHSIPSYAWCLAVRVSLFILWFLKWSASSTGHESPERVFCGLTRCRLHSRSTHTCSWHLCLHVRSHVLSYGTLCVEHTTCPTQYLVIGDLTGTRYGTYACSTTEHTTPGTSCIGRCPTCDVAICHTTDASACYSSTCSSFLSSSFNHCRFILFFRIIFIIHF